MSRFRLLAYFVIFGGIYYLYHNAYTPKPEEPSKLESKQRIVVRDKILSQRDDKAILKAKEERIRMICELLEQNLDEKFQLLTEGYDKKLIAKQLEIKKEINKLLSFDKITNLDMYKDVTENIREDHNKIQEAFQELGVKKIKIEAEMDRLEKLNRMIEDELIDLQHEFKEAEHLVENSREEHLKGFKNQLDTFLNEFSKIKAENEPTAFSYLNKVKDLIEEGEEYIKDIEPNIPKDLKSVKKDIRMRYEKLKFMIKEYYRDHESAATQYERIKQYFANYDPEEFAKMEKGTDQYAEFRKIRDEKLILQSLIQKMKDEIEVTREDLNKRHSRIVKIKSLSVSKKINLIKYYNEIDSLCTKMNRTRLVGGDISENLKDLQALSQGQDDLIIAITNDLLSTPHTSTNVVTSKKLHNYFLEQRKEYYWEVFQRKRTLLNIFGRSMYYMYIYLLLDHFKFEKKYAIPHVLKDDSAV